jgi:hypothetical protein
MQRYRDHSIDRGAVKALVALLGPREAARQAGISENTVLGWCRRFKWKKAGFLPKTTGINGSVPVKDDAAEALIRAVEKCREESTVNLAKYTERASRKAARHYDPLSIARNVRDVASVYNTIWPQGQENEMIEAGILIGDAKVTDNVEELEARVRGILSDTGQAGD